MVQYSMMCWRIAFEAFHQKTTHGKNIAQGGITAISNSKPAANTCQHHTLKYLGFLLNIIVIVTSVLELDPQDSPRSTRDFHE